MHLRFQAGGLDFCIGKPKPPPPLTVYIIRHGESEGNADKTNYSRIPNPLISLTTRGRFQAAEAAVTLGTDVQRRGFKNVRIYHSEYTRAIQTCTPMQEMLTDLGRLHSCRASDLIHEQDFGLMDGALKKETIRTLPDIKNLRRLFKDSGVDYFYRIFGGESPKDVGVRLESFIEQMRRAQQHEQIDAFVVVCHYVTAKVLAKKLTEQNVAWFASEPSPPNASIRLIQGEKDLGYIHNPPK